MACSLFDKIYLWAGVSMRIRGQGTTHCANCKEKRNSLKRVHGVNRKLILNLHPHLTRSGLCHDMKIHDPCVCTDFEEHRLC